MSPTTKKRGSAAESTSVTTASLLDTSKTILAKALSDLETVLAGLGKKLRAASSKKHDREGWSHHAWLTQRVAQIAGEARKLEISERSSGTRLTTTQVLAWARSLAPIERENVIGALEAMDDDGGVL